MKTRWIAMLLAAMVLPGIAWAGEQLNPCSMKKYENPCNPCSMKKHENPCNPCSMKKHENPCNPCAMEEKPH